MQRSFSDDSAVLGDPHIETVEKLLEDTLAGDSSSSQLRQIIA